MLYYPFFPSMRRPSRKPSSYTSSPSTASASSSSSSSHRTSRTHAKQNPGLALKASTLLARPPLCTHGYPTPPSGAAQSKKEDERKKESSFFSSSGLRFDSIRFSIFDWWFHARKARFSLSLLFSHPFLSSRRIVIRQKTPYVPLNVWTGPDPPDGASRPSVRPRHTTSRASSLSGNDRTTERPNTPLFFFLVRLIEEDTSSCLR